MRQSTKLRILLGALISLTSCAPLKKITPAENRRSISENNFQVLNGDYRATNNSGRTLAEALFKGTIKSDSSTTINLQCLDKGRIKITLRHQGKILNETTIKGKIKNDYFIVKPLYELRFWFIINGVSVTKTRIGSLNNTNLTVDTATDGIGLLIVIPAFNSGGAIYGLEYERKK